jgi:hypothetical protein
MKEREKERKRDREKEKKREREKDNKKAVRKCIRQFIILSSSHLLFKKNNFAILKKKIADPSTLRVNKKIKGKSTIFICAFKNKGTFDILNC